MKVLVLFALCAASAQGLGITVTRVTTVTQQSTVFQTCFSTASPLAVCRKKKQLWFMDTSPFYQQQLPYYVPQVQPYYIPVQSFQPQSAFRIQPFQPQVMPFQPYYVPVQHPFIPKQDPVGQTSQNFLKEAPAVKEESKEETMAAYEEKANDVVQEQQFNQDAKENDIESSFQGLTDDPNARLFFNLNNVFKFVTVTSTVVQVTTAKQTQTLAVSCIAPGAQAPQPACPPAPVTVPPKPSGNAG